jgi:hypothetical protein
MTYTGDESKEEDIFYYEMFLEPSIIFKPEENIVPLELWNSPEFVIVWSKFWMSGEIIIQKILEVKDEGSNPILIRDRVIEIA